MAPVPSPETHVKTLTWGNVPPTTRQAIYAYTGLSAHSSFGIKAIAGGAAYKLTNPLPGEKEFYDSDLDALKKTAQDLYDQFLKDVRVLLTRGLAMASIGKATEFTRACGAGSGGRPRST